MNLDAENRVVLNVGGIRHETYKVSDRFFFLPNPHTTHTTNTTTTATTTLISRLYVTIDQ